MNQALFRILLHVFLPLFFGFLIYWFYRPNVWIIQMLSDRAPLLKVEEMSLFQKLFIFTGTDFCWSYSFTSALIFYNSFQKNKIRHFPLIILSLILISELVQNFTEEHFTFDWVDLFAALIAFLWSIYLNRRNAEIH